MSLICKRLTIGMIVLGIVASSAVVAEAQYVVGYQPYQTYYAPAANYSSYYAPTAYQTYYAPSTVAYQSYYAPNAAAYQTYYAPAATTAAPVVYTSGWYPGYWFDRTRAALFGRRAVVAAPTTYAASYQPTYVASYPSNYVASYPTNHVASYASAAPACSTCVTPQQVTLRPACSTCEPCTNCAVTNVTPTSYVETSPACTNCSTTVVSNEPTPQSGPSQSTYNNTQQPQFNTNESVSPTRLDLEKPQAPSNHGPTTPVTGTSTGGENGESTNRSTEQSTDPLESLLNNPEKQKQESANFFKAPELFDAKDRTVKMSPAPMHMAVYKRPAGETPDSGVSARPISVEKAKRDAVGWSSASR